MRYLLSILLLIGTTQAHSADWTPVFADLLTPQSQKQLLGNQSPVNNFYPKLTEMVIDQANWVQQGMKLTQNAKKGNYPNIPQPYRADMQPAVITKTDRCTYEAKVPLKNATLFGKPIQSLNYHIYICETAPFKEYISFKPMTNKDFTQLQKRVAFKQIPVSAEEQECTSDKNYQAGNIYREGKKQVFAMGGPNFDCG